VDAPAGAASATAEDALTPVLEDLPDLPPEAFEVGRLD